MNAAATTETLLQDLRALGIQPGSMLEVHSSYKSLGPVQGGAGAVLDALTQAVGPQGAIVMPSFRLSNNLPLDEEDRTLGLTLKIRILDADEPRSGMGILPDLLRRWPDVRTGEGLFRVSAWGRDAELHCRQGFQRIIDEGGWALLIGVDIYRLSSMHYMEGELPHEITDIFRPSPAALARYPEGQWFIESGLPPVKAWYKIQDRAYDLGLIRDGRVGQARCMFFPVKPVVELYRQALQTDPLGLYSLR